MTNAGVQGRFLAVLAVALLPVVLSSTLNVLEKPSKRWWIAGLIATTLSVAFHAMVFYMAMVGIAVVAGLIVTTARISFKRVVLANAMIVLGVLIAWVLLPTELTNLAPDRTIAGALTSSGG